MNASALTLRALWFAMGATIATLAALAVLVAVAGVATLRAQPLTSQVFLLDAFLAFVLGGVVLWGLSPPRPVDAAGDEIPSDSPVERFAAEEELPGDLDAIAEMRIPPDPSDTEGFRLPPMMPAARAPSGVAASSILGTYEERRWSEDPVSSAPPWSEDPELMRASLSFTPGLHPELRADRYRAGPPPPPHLPLTPGIPDGGLRPVRSGSLSRSGARATSGPSSPLDRVPAPPGPSGMPMLGRRMCVSCGTGLAGATTDPLCAGCGRPLCSACYWRSPSGPAAHRCPTCVTEATHPSEVGRSGGHSTGVASFGAPVRGPPP